MPSFNIYCSFHERDAELVRVVIGHLNTLFAPGAVRYTDRATVPAGANTAEFSRHLKNILPRILESKHAGQSYRKLTGYV